jgi:hypothetical protein
MLVEARQHASDGAPAEERLQAASVAGERTTQLLEARQHASDGAPAEERIRAASVAGERGNTAAVERTTQ